MRQKKRTVTMLLPDLSLQYRPGIDLPLNYCVDKIKRHTDDIFTLTLSAKTESLTPFVPGQFNMLYLPGVGEVPISHSGCPSNPSTLVHTIRSVGAVTSRLSELKKGDVIGVRGPFGRGWPMERATGKDVIIGAGGVGMAPLRPVVYSIVKARRDFKRVILIYGVKTENDFIYQNEWKEWKNAGIEIFTTVGKASSQWKGAVGHITKLFPQIEVEPQNTVALFCGPEIMMRFSAFELQKKDVPNDNIFVSIERNMKCAIGFCGHCQFGPHFICKAGPVFPYQNVETLMRLREL